MSEVMKKLNEYAASDAGQAAAYEGLMRAKEAFRAEVHRLGRDLADAKEALKPFAELSDVCEHFNRKPDEHICSWKIAGKRYHGPTVHDCKRAKLIYGSTS